MNQEVNQSKQLKPIKIGDNLEVLKQCVRLQMLKVGLRPQSLPTDEQKHVLISFIQKHYANYSVYQISEAFDLAITGQLPLKDVSCYENFSCEYFGRIMAAYKSHLISTGQVQKNTDNERMARQETQLSLPPVPADWSKHVDDLKKQVQSGNIPAIIPVGIYDWLENENLICADYTEFLDMAKVSVLAMTKEEKQQNTLTGRGIGEVLADLNNLVSGNVNQRVINQAKRLAIIKYLKA